MSPLIITLIVLVVIIAAVAAAFNGLVVKRNRTQEAWADIDVQLKRRYDLIPNLINTVKGYANHESSTFEKITEARSKAMSGGSVSEQADAENMLSGTLKSLFAVAESYPELKADQNFIKLQEELADTENKIQAARRFYNTTILTFNTAVETFPGNIYASIFGFSKKDFFELEEGSEERENVKVEF